MVWKGVQSKRKDDQKGSVKGTLKMSSISRIQHGKMEESFTHKVRAHAKTLRWVEFGMFEGEKEELQF